MTRGSLIGLGAGAGGAVLAGILGVFLAMHGCGEEPGAGPRGPDHAAQIGSAGMTAKGTAELRGAGCANAVVVDMAKLLGAGGTVREGEPRYMVTCDVPGATAAPPCDRLASIYFRAVGADVDGNVCVRVVAQGARDPACSRLYAPSGADLGVFPRLP